MDHIRKLYAKGFWSDMDSVLESSEFTVFTALLALFGLCVVWIVDLTFSVYFGCAAARKDGS